MLSTKIPRRKVHDASKWVIVENDANAERDAFVADADPFSNRHRADVLGLLTAKGAVALGIWP